MQHWPFLHRPPPHAPAPRDPFLCPANPDRTPNLSKSPLFLMSARDILPPFAVTPNLSKSPLFLMPASDILPPFDTGLHVAGSLPKAPPVIAAPPCMKDIPDELKSPDGSLEIGACTYLSAATVCLCIKLMSISLPEIFLCALFLR